MTSRPGRRLATALMAALLAVAAAARTPRQSWAYGAAADTAALRGAVTGASHPLAGVYALTTDGSRVALIPAPVPGLPPAPGTLLIVVCEACDPAIRPGTVMGWMRPTGTPGRYEGELFTTAAGTALAAPRRFAMNASDPARPRLRPLKGSLKIELYKLLPYLYRAPVSTRPDDRDPDRDALIRLYPPSPSTPPAQPRAL